MDFQSNKISQPFNPSSNYFQGLSNNIQNRVGIEVKNVVDTKAPKIEYKKKQKPIQLTVEFGFPLTAEKTTPIDSDKIDVSVNDESTIKSNQIIDTSNNLVKDDEIGQIHIDPIQLSANPNPYWHNFNSDDELEGLVLDSEGQEMSDITINGDAMFDIDQHFFQKDKSENVVNEILEVNNEVIEVAHTVNELENVQSKESKTTIESTSSVVIGDELPKNDILSVVNEIEIIKNDVTEVVEGIQQEETFFSFSFIPEISAVSEVATIANEVESIEVAQIVNEVESIEVAPILNEVEYSFSDADLDNLHEQMSQQVETVQVKQSVQLDTPEITFVEFSTNEIAIDPEREYTDAELDMLHEQLSKEIQASKPRVAESAYVATPQVEYQFKVEANKTVSQPVLEEKPSIMEMIPWSSVFGIVASLMAVASAWFIWNSIQKPIAIDEFIDSKLTPMVSQVNTPSAVDNVDNTLSLAPADFIVNEILLEVDNPSTKDNNFNFVNLSEQSKISAVVLESNGLTTLEFEDGFFEDLGI